LVNDGFIKSNRTFHLSQMQPPTVASSHVKVGTMTYNTKILSSNSTAIKGVVIRGGNGILLVDNAVR